MICVAFPARVFSYVLIFGTHVYLIKPHTLRGNRHVNVKVNHLTFNVKGKMYLSNYCF